MIFGKFFGAIRAQLNKLANFFWEADPIAQMQYEYDMAVEQLKEGRLGLGSTGRSSSASPARSRTARRRSPS